jgi:hypothetical protein
MTLKKYLPFIFLLVAMLLVSFNSFANDLQSGAVKDECACHLLDKSASLRIAQLRRVTKLMQHKQENIS